VGGQPVIVSGQNKLRLILGMTKAQATCGLKFNNLLTSCFPSAERDGEVPKSSGSNYRVSLDYRQREASEVEHADDSGHLVHLHARNGSTPGLGRVW